MKLNAYVGGLGIVGPGLNDWSEARGVLSGTSVYRPLPTVLPVPTLLPAAERRRTGRVVKLAIAVALEATQRAAVEPASLASVFSSSGGDGHNCHEICEALTLASREISPTRFANSVHNAASGYWSIATAAKLESSVLCAFDASFCAGLLEAVTQVCVDDEALLLVAYDTEYPHPLHAKRPVPDAFGAAFVLTPRQESSSLARLEVSLVNEHPDQLEQAALEWLRHSIPAARCLPLLRQLALGTAGRIVLDYLDVSQVAVQVQPCH